jgi:F-type H+-transporting ATPase subunit gamma
VASVRDLRDRIRSLKNTQQITKAMKQVAAAKIRRAEAARGRARPYADALAEMLGDLIAAVSSVDHPFMKPGKTSAPSGIVLMSADKGLAGAFNSNVIRAGEEFARSRGGALYYTVGTKARNAVRRMGAGDRPSWPLGAGSKLETARAVAAAVTGAFERGEISEIVLVSQKLVSMMVQRPHVRKLVPIEDSLSPQRAREAGGSKGAIEFSPSPEFVLSRLLPKYLEFTLYSAMLETDAAFFAAQLVAMTNATDNASNLIDELTLAMNNARQAAITKELLEIVAGAEALGVE